MKKAGQKRSEEEARRPDEEEDENDAAREEGLTVESEGTEEEAAEILRVALGIEVDGEGDGEEVGDGTLRSLRAMYFLTWYAEPSGTMLVDAHNGFNELRRLAILWTVRHCWPVEARFAFNCYRH